MDDEERFKRALDFRADGNLKEALNIMLDIVSRVKDSMKLFLTLGSIYWDDLKNNQEAIKYFKKAIELCPTSEIASLGLFHCLWELDQTDEAFEEMKRFMSISDSKDYRSIMKEIKEKNKEYF